MPAKPLVHGRVTGRIPGTADPDGNGSDGRRFHVVAVLAIVALAIGLYLPALDGEFVFDDSNGITLNSDIQTLRPLTKFLGSNRPLTDLSFALNFAAGGLRTRGFHLTNMVLHALAGVLVYCLAFTTLGLPVLAARRGRGRPWIALTTAAWFVSHPLQSEVAAYVSSRSEVLAAAFYLLTVLVYVRLATACRRPALAGVGGIAILASLAMASKEMAVTVPAALVLYDWCFLAGADWHAVLSRWKLWMPSFFPIAVATPILLQRAIAHPGGTTAGFGFERFSGFEYLLSQFGVILRYLSLVFAPIGQCFDYDWPLARTPWALGVAVPMSLVGALMVAAYRTRRCWPPFTFALLWMLLVLVPTSSFLPLADLIAERRMYLALFGPLLLAASLLWSAACRFTVKPQLTFAVVALLVVAPFSVLTQRRAALWASRGTLYAHSAACAPTNPRAWLNVAAVNVELRRYDLALPQLTEALRLYESGKSVHAFHRIGAFIHLNLGVIQYREKQDHAQAERHFLKALELGPQFARLRSVAAMYLGHTHYARQDWQSAIAYYIAAIQYADAETQRESLLKLARAYRKTGQIDLARQRAAELLRIDPQNPGARSLLAQLDRH